MKKITIALFIVLVSIAVNGQENQKAEEVSTYYLIRHAEKVISENLNPDLDSKGELRAIQWSEVFENISFDAVYSTDFLRTKNTAMPTAKSQSLDLSLYHPVNIDYTEFLLETKGKTVLIVGHSNTIPHFVNVLIGKSKYELIKDDSFGNIYIVEITKDIIIDKLLYIK